MSVVVPLRTGQAAEEAAILVAEKKAAFVRWIGPKERERIELAKAAAAERAADEALFLELQGDLFEPPLPAIPFTDNRRTA